MDINTRVEKEVDSPIYIRSFVWIFDILPPPNTIKGIFAYTFMVYIIVTIIKLISFKIAKNKGRDVDCDTTGKSEFMKKLEETRKRRSVEANKILDKINKVY
jgi:hypothetical protein